MASVSLDVRTFVAERLVARNPLSRSFFDRHSERLAVLCEEMANRFMRGGRLLAFGRGACATDAQHVAVEFVHPVIVGKRALPAVDVSAAFDHWVPALVSEHDIVLGFAPPPGDPAVALTLQGARDRGALTLALSGEGADFSIEAPDTDSFASQEIVEILYHTLWETVHVFFEHRERGHEDVGASGFLYPFLGAARQDTSHILGEVASSIRGKAAEDERLRQEVARTQSEQIAEAVAATLARIRNGGTVLFFGNGGSATDANDWAIDCVTAARHEAVRALSLSMEPATLTALVNDVGRDPVFLRQIVAHGRPGDVAVAISTSGGSANVIAALEEARKRGLLTLALLGYDGGEIVRRKAADLSLVVPCDYIPRIQEVQASIYHVITEAWRRWRT